MPRYLALLLLMIPTLLQAQLGGTAAAGSRGLAMGDASVTFNDINSLFANEAGLAQLKNPGLLAFAEQRFFISELRSLNAGVAYPTKSGVFGLQVSSFGFEDYREQRIGLAYARQLSSKLDIGASFQYYVWQITEYGNLGVPSFQLGLQAKLAPVLRLGVHLANPIGQEIVEGENLPTVFRLGLAYLPTKQLQLHAEVEKDIDFEARVKMGLEYHISDPLFIRVGIQTNPSFFSFGLGYVIQKNIKIDIAANYHQQLGFSPGFTIIGQF